MNRNTKPSVDADKGIASFQINMTGDVNNHSYLGNFIVKCVLSPIEEIEADKLYRELLGDHMVMASEKAKDYAFALAQLKHRIVEFPPFWQTNRMNGNLEDTNVTIDVLNLAIDSEEMYKELKDKERVKIEKRLTRRIKDKTIEKEADTESIQKKIEKQDETVEMD